MRYRVRERQPLRERDIRLARGAFAEVDDADLVAADETTE
jgi:hypothetical protein